MKTLIVYYSFTENNKKLATHIQERLNCALAKIETVTKRNAISIMLDLVFSRKPKLKPLRYCLSDYDHIIFVGPIWAGKVATPLMTLMANEVEHVKQYSFITLCGGSPGQKEKIERELVSVLQKAPLKLIELWINDLLPTEKRGAIQYTSRYRVEPAALTRFDKEIDLLITPEVVL